MGCETTGGSMLRYCPSGPGRNTRNCSRTTFRDMLRACSWACCFAVRFSSAKIKQSQTVNNFVTHVSTQKNEKISLQAVTMYTGKFQKGHNVQVLGDHTHTHTQIHHHYHTINSAFYSLFFIFQNDMLLHISFMWCTITMESFIWLS